MCLRFLTSGRRGGHPTACWAALPGILCITGDFVLRGFVSGEASGDDKLPRDWTNGDVGSSRHVKSVDVGHRGGERRVRGQGGVRSTSPATWVECLVWVAGRGSTELTFLSSCKRRRQCDDFLCPKVTIFVTPATVRTFS